MWDLFTCRPAAIARFRRDRFTSVPVNYVGHYQCCVHLVSRVVLAKPKQIIVLIRIITIILVLLLIWIITRFIVRRSKDAGRCEEHGNVVVKTIRLAASHIKRFIILALQCSLAASHTARLVPLWTLPILLISSQILHNWKLLTFRLLRLSGTQLRIVHLIRWTNIYY